MLCHSCGKEISDTASFCPYCGTPTVAPTRDLTEIPEEPTPSRPPEPRSTTRNRLITVVAGVILGLCLLLALFLVIDPFRLHLIDRLTGSYDPVITAMPPETTVYFGVNLLEVDRDRLQEITTAFQEAAGDTDVGDFEDEMDEAVDETLDEFDLTLEDDILPWAGQFIGVGISDVTLDDFGGFDAERSHMIIAIEARDRGAADDFLAKFVDTLSNQYDTRVDEQEYENVLIYEMETGSDIDRVALARSDNLVLIGNGVDAIEDAIDAQERDSLRNEDAYRDVMAKLPRKRALTMYFDASLTDDIRADLENELGVDSDVLGVSGVTGIGMALSLVDAGVQFDLVTTYDSDNISEAQSELLRSASEGKLDERFPEDTVVFWTGTRLDLVWSVIRDFAVDAVGGVDFDESMEMFEDEFGFNPDLGLFPLLDGAWAIGVTSSGQGGFVDELGIDMAFLGLVETSDGDALAALADDFSSELKNQGISVDQLEEGDFMFHELADGPDTIMTYGTGDGLLLIGSSSDTLEEVATRRKSESLAESERYKSTWREFPGGMAPVLYVDLQGLLATIRDGLSGFDREDFDETTSFIDPITIIAMATETGNRNVSHQTLLVFIETE